MSGSAARARITLFQPRFPRTTPAAGHPTLRRVLAAGGVVVTVGLMTGCSTPPATPAPPTAAPAPATGAPADPARSAEDVACADHTTSAATVRRITDAIAAGPVLPAGVALFLLDVRSRAAAPGVTDPALVAARAEFVAAIDDLDKQGWAGLPEGGNPAQDLVTLDGTRILAASRAVEEACAALA